MKCKTGNSIYYPRGASTMQNLIDILNNTKTSTSSPILEEEMFKQKYHNTILKMIQDRDI